MPADRRLLSASRHGSGARKFDLDLILNDSSSSSSSDDDDVVGGTDAHAQLQDVDGSRRTSGVGAPQHLLQPSVDETSAPVHAQEPPAAALVEAEVVVPEAINNCDDVVDDCTTIAGGRCNPSSDGEDNATTLAPRWCSEPSDRQPLEVSHDANAANAASTKADAPSLIQGNHHTSKDCATRPNVAVLPVASWPGMMQRLESENNDLRMTVERLESELRQSRLDMRFLQDAQTMLHANDISADAVAQLEAAHRDRERCLEEQVSELLETVAMWKGRALAERNVTIPVGDDATHNGPEPRAWGQPMVCAARAMTGVLSHGLPVVFQQGDAPTGPRGRRNAASQATPPQASCGTSCSPTGTGASVTTQTHVTGPVLLAELSQQHKKGVSAMRLMQYDAASQTVDATMATTVLPAPLAVPVHLGLSRHATEAPRSVASPIVIIPRRHVGLQCTLVTTAASPPAEGGAKFRRSCGVQAIAALPRMRNASTSTVAMGPLDASRHVVGGLQRQYSGPGEVRHMVAQGVGGRGSRALVNSLALLKHRIATLQQPLEASHGDEAVHLGVPELQLVRRDTNNTAAGHIDPQTSSSPSFVFECEDATPSANAAPQRNGGNPSPHTACPEAACLSQLIPKLLTVVDEHIHRQREAQVATAAAALHPQTERGRFVRGGGFGDTEWIDEAEDATQHTPRMVVPQPIKCFRETATSPVRQEVPNARVRTVSICDDGPRVDEEREANVLLKRLLRRTEAAFKGALHALHHENTALRQALERTTRTPNDAYD